MLLLSLEAQKQIGPEWTAWDFVHLISILNGSPSSAMHVRMLHCVPVITYDPNDSVFLWKSTSDMSHDPNQGSNQ